MRAFVCAWQLLLALVGVRAEQSPSNAAVAGLKSKADAAWTALAKHFGEDTATCKDTDFWTTMQVVAEA